MKISRNSFFLLAILLMIVIIMIVYFLSRSASQKETNLTITSTPSPIRIFIGNNKYQTPITVPLKNGSYTISGDKVGYQTYTGQYNMDGKDHSIVINLSKENIPSTQYSPDE